MGGDEMNLLVKAACAVLGSITTRIMSRATLRTCRVDGAVLFMLVSEPPEYVGKIVRVRIRVTVVENRGNMR